MINPTSLVFFILILLFSTCCNQKKEQLSQVPSPIDSTNWIIDESSLNTDRDWKYVNSKWFIIDKESFLDSVTNSDFGGVQLVNTEGERIVKLKYISANLKPKIAEELSGQLQQSQLINKTFPDFDFIDLAGNKITNKMLLEKIIVINYWFIGCKGCMAEIDSLNELVGKYSSNNNIVFLAPAKDSLNRLITFSLKNEFKYRIGKLTSKNSIPITTYPTNIVVDQRGKIRYVSTGGSNFIGEILSGKIEELLKPTEQKKI